VPFLFFLGLSSAVGWGGQVVSKTTFVLVKENDNDQFEGGSTAASQCLFACPSRKLAFQKYDTFLFFYFYTHRNFSIGSTDEKLISLKQC